MVAQEKSLQVVQPGAVAAMNVETLLLRAVEHNVPIDTLERLMTMRRELVTEQARTAFFTALAGFQAECPVITKTEAVRDRGGNSVRYRFAPLDRIVSTIQPYLQKYELSYTFNAVFDLENQHLIAVCEVHHALGHTEASEFRVPIASDNFMNKAQHFGSASSYAKRYALCNALGLLTGDEDDDAQAAQPQTRPAAPQRSQESVSRTEPAPDAPKAPSAPASAERVELLEQVTARCIELGYDTAKQLKARAHAVKKTDVQLREEVIPSLDRLIEARRKEESTLRSEIHREFAHLKYSAEDIAEYMQKNHGGAALDGMPLEQLKQVASGLEIK